LNFLEIFQKNTSYHLFKNHFLLFELKKCILHLLFSNSQMDGCPPFLSWYHCAIDQFLFSFGFFDHKERINWMLKNQNKLVKTIHSSSNLLAIFFYTMLTRIDFLSMNPNFPLIVGQVLSRLKKKTNCRER